MIPLTHADQPPGSPQRRSGCWRALLVVAVLIAMTGCTLRAERVGGPNSRVGHPAPDFSLPTAEGGAVRLSNLRGRVVLVNFWGTYCPPCTEEMPELQQLYERHEPAGFTVLGVDVEEPPGVVQAFAAQHGLTFPLLLSDDASVNPTFGIRALPTSWILDRSGIVRQVWVGKISVGQAERRIESLLAERG